MKKWLSYLWPITTKVTSEHNGILEITYYNGKKVLDSKNANYSFGSLQKILETGISKVSLKNTDSVLVLGLGGGSVIASLRNKFNYQRCIEAVELDATIINIAQQEFNITNSSTLTIHHKNALDFIYQNTKKHDLIIVDLFIDNKVPTFFYEASFCQSLQNTLTSSGAIIFNLGMEMENNFKAKIVTDFFISKEVYKITLLEKVMGTNTLLIAQKK